MIFRTFFAVLFILAGLLHFVLTPAYISIMPPYLPSPRLLVQVSGLCEILGGIGLLVPLTRTVAAWGLIALLICVMPANLQMALHSDQWPKLPAWILWVRLPAQLPLIWWAWLYTRR